MAKKENDSAASGEAQSQVPVASTMEITKKLTFKALAGVPSQADIREAIKAGVEILPQKLHVLGICNGTKITTNPDTGEAYEALSGEFIAYTPDKPQEKTTSALCYLPPIAFQLVVGKLTEETRSVEFALEIGTRLPREGERSPVGYIYTVKPLVKPSNNDPMQRLLAKVENPQLSNEG